MIDCQFENGGNAPPSKTISQVFAKYNGTNTIVTIILNGSYPDVMGLVVDVGVDFVMVKVQTSLNPLQYIPYSSICEFWFSPAEIKKKVPFKETFKILIGKWKSKNLES